ncbi:putative aspartyl aminopeptidase [Onchocerca flexuosa]|uniref:Aspartyl aminopeptidase n=1 Tax=Onchocerca flexuosa TaxID=387005 RepID=A0A238BMD8_9BILA|nr:putative aspartyl aminopeptidase [Onchocerca flexuosa]
MNTWQTSTEMRKAAKDFVTFLNKAVTPFHAVEESANQLRNAGFQELKESEHWTIEPLKKYFVTKNKSTILAFAVGGKYRPGNGYSMIVAHTDSPSLRVKPISKLCDDKYIQIGVSTYGGGLWRTWFDRDLSIAGQDNAIVQKLVNIDDPVLFIPSLAIHFVCGSDRNKFEFNSEINLRPIIATLAAEKLNNKAKDDCSADNVGVNTSNVMSDHHMTFLNIIASAAGCEPADILDFDLYLYDHQKATIGGVYQEFISGQRLDNLVGAYTCISGLLNSVAAEDALVNEENIRLAACYDNEECGSASAQGAESSFTEWILRRLTAGDSQVAFEEAMGKSFLISADQAHAVHPNYKEKHEECHKPDLHGGVVVKVNVNQRYATTATTHSILKQIACLAGVPLQKVVVRNDMPCGSTIGPILSTRLGIQTVDVGCPQLAMHSIRELASTSSIHQAITLYSAFYQQIPHVLASVS